MPSTDRLDTHHKALTLNLDPSNFGSFAKSAPHRKSRAVDISVPPGQRKRIADRGAGPWHGPIVMNTQEELRQAFSDLRDGTFIQRRAPWLSASSSRSLIRNIADVFEIEFVGTTLMIEVGRIWKPAFQRVFGLRPWCMCLMPSELDAPTKFAAPS